MEEFVAKKSSQMKSTGTQKCEKKIDSLKEEVTDIKVSYL